MTMMPFHVLFPEEARTECRTVTPINQAGLPNRTFLLMELYREQWAKWQKQGGADKDV